MIEMTKADLIEKLPSLLAEPKRTAVVITDGDEEVGALVSMEDYEIVRKAKIDRLMQAIEALGDSLREAATEEGIPLEELERMFDRKAD